MLKDSSLYKRLAKEFEPDLLNQLENNAIILNYKSGQIVLDVNQPIQLVSIVLDGTFKASTVNEDGQEILLYYVREGESCAMSFTSSMMSYPSIVRGAAEDDGSLLCIPIHISDEWMVKYPSWKKFVMSTIVKQFSDVIKTVEDVSFRKMDDRLIDYLKEKTKISGSKLVNLSHQQIADELGTNRVVISRLLKKLENEEILLLYRNQIKLLKEL